jgi:hypothetical protein
MSAVVEAVSNVVSSVVDTVGSAVDAVGDAVTTVVNKIGDVAQKVIDNPVPVLLAVAGQAVGIPAPLTMGMITAAQGGSLEDIALSAGTAYLAPSVGSSLTTTFSETLVDAGLSQTTSDVVAYSTSKGLVNGAIAEAKGGSFDDGFAGGFTGGVVGSGVGAVTDYVKPDVIQMAQDNGVDLKDANTAFNSATKALSAGVTAGVTGKDFATAFTNSAIGSTVDAGGRSVNSAIDTQFADATQKWNEKDPENPIPPTPTSGAGVPSDIVNAVKVSDTGVDSKPVDTPPENVADVKVLPEVATPNPTVSSDAIMAQAPKAETVTDIAKPDVAPTDVTPPAPPVGGLASTTDTDKPVDLSSITSPIVASTPDAPVISEAPVATNLLQTPDSQTPPAGGLNTVKTADDKLAEAQGLKATDVTKPLVATVGSMLKSALTQKAPTKPAGGLQIASAKPRMPTPPPARMDVSKLIPIQRAGAMPPKSLPSTAKLSPVTNIAGLSALLKKTG